MFGRRKNTQAAEVVPIAGDGRNGDDGTALHAAGEAADLSAETGGDGGDANVVTLATAAKAGRAGAAGNGKVQISASPADLDDEYEPLEADGDAAHADGAAGGQGDDAAREISADAKSSGFGRRRADRITRSVLAAAATKSDEPGVDASMTDRAAQPAEAAEMTRVNRASVLDAKQHLQPMLMDVMDVATAAKLPRGELAQQINDILLEILEQQKLQLNMFEQRDLVTLLINDMIGLGPLEPLLADESISEVMVNGPKQIYIERDGKLSVSDIKFHDDQHVMNIAQRIVGGVGRRVDESSPICDARLADGSRVNIIVPPLAIDGPTITIRKFKQDKLTFDAMIGLRTMSPACAKLLSVIAACRCNILISGGTGSGKTTLLNCLTSFIDRDERVITCEDAAELQLQQPHVVRLETRPPNLEGIGEITMRDLVKNCLRMRPERIIVGEVRGPEAFDLLQAMNTGHDGSMGTVHANNPREAISRLENMIAMGGFNMSAKAVRDQIASALNVIIQTQRLRDGSRKVTHVTEVIGMEGEVVTLQDLFVFDFDGQDRNGNLVGTHRATGLRPAFWERARYFNLEKQLAESLEEEDR